MKYVQFVFGVIAVCGLLIATPAYAGRPDVREMTIPSGTVIPVRMIDSISSDRNYAGETFIATLLNSEARVRPRRPRSPPGLERRSAAELELSLGAERAPQSARALGQARVSHIEPSKKDDRSASVRRVWWFSVSRRLFASGDRTNSRKRFLRTPGVDQETKSGQDVVDYFQAVRR
jgi:hypothetical protein